MSTSYCVDMKSIVWKHFVFFVFFWFLQWFFECFVYMPLVFLVFWMVFWFFPVLKQNFEKNVLRQNIHFFVVVPPWLVTQNIAKRTYGIGKDITLSPGSWWGGGSSSESPSTSWEYFCYAWLGTHWWYMVYSFYSWVDSCGILYSWVITNGTTYCKRE